METYAFVKWAMQFPAVSVIAFMRPNIGYRFLNPAKLIAVTACVIIIAAFAGFNHPDARPLDLMIFALLACLNGIAQRIRRWWGLNRGVQRHSYYIGDSPFDFRWLPNFIRRNRRVARFIDPIFCAGIGIALLPYSRALGVWLIISAISLRAFEDQVFRRERNRDLDLMDGLIISEQQAQKLEQFEQSKNAPQYQPDEGIPTGLGDDIKKKIKTTRRKSNDHENN